METIEVTINTTTPPANLHASFARMFREIAEKFNSASADVHDYEDGLRTTYIARFTEAKNAAQFAAFFHKNAGLECHILTPPILN